MNDYKGFVVAVGGPPHSGKSIFLTELYRQILARRPSGFCFLQRACPDGEGMWSNESDPEIVREIRRKGKFSSEFILFTLKSIENLGRVFPLVLLDLGGLRTAENAEILARCTHLIIISRTERDNEEWAKFAADEGCETIGTFTSQLVKRADGSLDETVISTVDLTLVDLTLSPVRGKMLNLDREGPAEPYREAIDCFAEWLIAKVDSLL